MTERPEKPKTDFLKLISELKKSNPPIPTEADASLPSCPLCGAVAVAGKAYASWSSIEHLCQCHIEAPDAYDAGLRRLWSKENAEPYLVSTLPLRFRDTTLDNIPVNDDNRELLETLRGPIRGNVFLFGAAGIGKTLAAVGLARRLAAERRSARFWQTPALLNAIKASFDPEVQSRPVLDHWDVLVLDDLDKVNPTPFVFEALFGAIDRRWSNRKITIFTSQLDPEETASLIAREGNTTQASPLFSRLASGLVIPVDGEDHRIGEDA